MAKTRTMVHECQRSEWHTELQYTQLTRREWQWQCKKKNFKRRPRMSNEPVNSMNQNRDEMKMKMEECTRKML